MSIPDRRRAWVWMRNAGALAILTVLVVRVGAGPFVDGVRAVDVRALGAAVVIGAITTLCVAWRWRRIAAGMGVPLTLPSAVAASYRSQFLNLTLPGGVVGDVHRGVDHGRRTGDVGRALRAIVLERTAGQIVQAILTAAVLLVLPSPVRSAMPAVLAAVVLVAAVATTVAVRVRGDASSRWSRVKGAVARDVREGLMADRAWVAVTVVSAIAVAGYATVFVIAANVAGADASVRTLLPIALLAMLAMVLPGIAGLGPREGATAWAFAAAGLGAGRGVATAVAFGVMSLVASLPGAAVLVAGLVRGARTSAPIVARPDGAADG